MTVMLLMDIAFGVGAYMNGAMSVAIVCGVSAIIGTVFIEIIVFGETSEALRLACIAMIIGGIIGHKLITTT